MIPTASIAPQNQIIPALQSWRASTPAPQVVEGEMQSVECRGRGEERGRDMHGRQLWAGPMPVALSWHSVRCCCRPKGGADGTAHCADKREERGQGRGGLGSEVLAAIADDVKPTVRRRSLPAAPEWRRRGCGRVGQVTNNMETAGLVQQQEHTTRAVVRVGGVRRA